MSAIEAVAPSTRAPWAVQALWAEQILAPDLDCNSGGPKSRTRSIELRATLLGPGSGHISCPNVRQVALDFGDEEPVPHVLRLVEELGYRSPEAARDALVRPAERRMCFASDGITPTRTADAPPEIVLEIALILGLSTASMFDPDRPVIWTRASLSRRLALYDLRGFYA